jgi:hypothetical protein
MLESAQIGRRLPALTGEASRNAACDLSPMEKETGPL